MINNIFGNVNNFSSIATENNQKAIRNLKEITIVTHN